MKKYILLLAVVLFATMAVMATVLNTGSSKKIEKQPVKKEVKEKQKNCSAKRTCGWAA